MFCYFSRYTPAPGWGIIPQSENECCQARVRNSARLPPQTQLGAAVLVLPCRIAAAYKHTGIYSINSDHFCAWKGHRCLAFWSCRPSVVKYIGNNAVRTPHRYNVKLLWVMTLLVYTPCVLYDFSLKMNEKVRSSSWVFLPWHHVLVLVIFGCSFVWR
jgi:hypothetical protein